MKPPRLPDSTRDLARQRATDALRVVKDRGGKMDDASRAAADAAIGAVWEKLVGDARDRVAHLISAAHAYIEAVEVENPIDEDVAAKRRGLLEAIDEIDPATRPPDGGWPE